MKLHDLFEEDDLDKIMAAPKPKITKDLFHQRTTNNTPIIASTVPNAYEHAKYDPWGEWLIAAKILGARVLADLRYSDNEYKDFDLVDAAWEPGHEYPRFSFRRITGGKIGKFDALRIDHDGGDVAYIIHK